jgi:hypothetical protein
MPTNWLPNTTRRELVSAFCGGSQYKRPRVFSAFVIGQAGERRKSVW